MLTDEWCTAALVHGNLAWPCFNFYTDVFNIVEFVKEYFKDSGGLLFLIDLLTSVDNCEVQERTLFCLGCAIERNGKSQSLTDVHVSV